MAGEARGARVGDAVQLRGSRRRRCRGWLRPAMYAPPLSSRPFVSPLASDVLYYFERSRSINRPQARTARHTRPTPSLYRLLCPVRLCEPTRSLSGQTAVLRAMDCADCVCWTEAAYVHGHADKICRLRDASLNPGWSISPRRVGGETVEADGNICQTAFLEGEASSAWRDARCVWTVPVVCVYQRS